MDYASRLVFPIEEGRRGLRENWRARQEDKMGLESLICRSLNEGLNGLMQRNGRKSREESVEGQPDKLTVC